MAVCDDTMTTRPTPQSFAARRTLSVPFNAGSTSSFFNQAAETPIYQLGLAIYQHGFFQQCLIKYGEGSNCLGVLCRVQDDRRSNVEDAAGALDRRPHGVGFEEVHLEQPESRVRSIQGLQVLRLALVL